MGLYGYKIDESDLFYEIKQDLQQSLHNNPQIVTAVESVKRQYADSPDKSTAIISLAVCAWKGGLIVPTLYKEAIALIDEKTDLRLCKELGADEEFLSKRAEELERCKKLLQREPVADQLWLTPSQRKTPIIKKGDCFWYRMGGKIYGGVVMEMQISRFSGESVYLILLTIALEREPKKEQEILSADSYTAAWFDVEDLLEQKRFHVIASLPGMKEYTNMLGRKETDDGICNRNSGSRSTWAHTFRLLSFHGEPVNQILDPSRTFFN